MSKKINRNKFREYQIDCPEYGGVKCVADLTEDEAKFELCKLMDIIDKLENHVCSKGKDIIDKWRYRD